MTLLGEINIQLIRDVKIPTRSGNDSGYDLYVPNDINDLYNAENCKFTPSDYITEEIQKQMKMNNFMIEDDYITIPAGHGILIPSGIKMQLPLGGTGSAFDFVLHNKSGICTKTGLIVGAQVIDNEYRGEIHYHLINTSPYRIIIKPGQKITQGILRAAHFRNIYVVDNVDENTLRGDKGFGSTGIA